MAIKRTGRNGAHRPWNKEVSPLLNEMPELLSILKEVREYGGVSNCCQTICRPDGIAVVKLSSSLNWL